MTPAIELAKARGLTYHIHEYHHDPSAPSFGSEAADKLGVDGAQVFKTLVVIQDTGKLAVAIVPVSRTLNLKSMAKALGCKKVTMAEPKAVERSSGYVLGGVSPLGQKKRLATIIDQSATDHAAIYVSAGRRGLEIELAPTDLAAELSARFFAIAEQK